ncbi:hypothetical protein Pst134EB_026233 [Puccinia striiformis f. sp. tritici]|nr:hypothetical protein Pst134EB_026233 [Puccinia striiformis f. sp. tritici]
MSSRILVRILRSNSRARTYSTKSKQKQQQDDSLPAGVSPWARFMDVLKSEYAKSQEIQQNVRELTGTAQGIKDSEAAQRMRKAYTAMRLESLIKENPKLATMAKTLSSTGKSVSEAVNRAATEIEESRIIKTARQITQEIDKRIGEPIRQTEVYKVVEDTVDFSQGALRYGGYIEKEERVRRRQKRLERLAKSNPHSSIIKETSSSSPSTTTTTTVPNEQYPNVVENPDAPPALVLHSTANKDDSSGTATMGSRMKATLSPIGFKEIWSSLQESYTESENPVIASVRSVTGFLRRNLIDETETAKVIRLVKEVDPNFNYDGFLADLREFIIPDFVDSFVENDLKSIKLWTSEAAFNVTTAPMKLYLQRGLRPANQIIDLKGIDILSAKVLEERDLPVFIVAFKTHEINCYINPTKKQPSTSSSKASSLGGVAAETQEDLDDMVEVGSRDQIQVVQYVVVLTKETLLNSSAANPKPEEEEQDEEEGEGGKKDSSKNVQPDHPQKIKVDDPSSPKLGNNDITGGWKIIDLARRSSVAFL